MKKKIRTTQKIKPSATSSLFSRADRLCRLTVAFLAGQRTLLPDAAAWRRFAAALEAVGC